MISHTSRCFKMPFIKIFQAPNPLRSPSDLGSNLSHNTSTWSWRREGGCHEQTWTSTCGSLRCTARRATWVCTGTSTEVPHINLNPDEFFLTLQLMFCLILKRTSRVKSVFTKNYNSLSHLFCIMSSSGKLSEAARAEMRTWHRSRFQIKFYVFFSLFCVLIVPCWKSVVFYLKIHFNTDVLLLDTFSRLLFPRPAIQKRAANSYLLMESI